MLKSIHTNGLESEGPTSFVTTKSLRRESVRRMQCRLILSRHCPIRLAADTWYGIDLGMDIHFEVGAAQNSFTVNPRHRLHFACWVIEAHQP